MNHSAKNQKDLLALSLVQQLLGTGPRTPVGEGSGPLAVAAAKAAKDPVGVSSLNISYSDSGLFGLTVAASPSDINNVLKAVVAKWRETAKGIKDADIQKAK